VIEFVLHRLRIPFIYSKGKTRFDYEIFRRLWEAKAQFTTMPPRLYYESNVSDLRYDHQLVFGYIFVSVECHKGHREDIYAYHTAYVCGACTRAHLEQHHVHHRKGETFRKCTFSYDCRSIRNALLTPVAHLERLSPLPA
jgi:hypothetical protein